jgi:undecaprenyl-phosphate 4-deoxy-4-formamido-L-arabinose transferase
MVNFSIVIPVFRATTILEKILFDSIELYQDNLKQVIFVFDGGEENSWKQIELLALKYPIVKGIKLSRNFGQHNATICGFNYVNTEFVVTMDEDYQHNPKVIADLLKKQSEQDFDVVYADFINREHNFFRNTTSTILKKLLKFGIPNLNENYSSFRLIRSSVAIKTIQFNNSYTFLDGYLTWLTSNFSYIKIHHLESQAGASSYNLKKLINHSLNIFLTFSNLPIRLVSFFALLFFIASFTYASIIVLSAFIYKDYAIGFPTLISILCFGIGTILLCIGTIGEYIARITMKMTNKPNYNIEKETTH